MKTKYLIVIERGERNYSAYSPDLPGCIATVGSIEDTIGSIRSAIEFHLEGMLENGERPPTPRSLANFVAEANDIGFDDILTTVEADIPVLASV